MTIARFLRSTMFSIFLLFGLVAVSTTALCVYTVDKQLSSQYVANSAAIAQTIANSSTDIILNRDMSTLQSLIDQFKEIQGVKYLYITNEQGEIIAHTFVPGVPKEIVQKVYDALIKTLALPATRDAFERLGAEVISCTPEEFSRRLARDLAQWQRVQQKTSIQLE